MLYVNQLRNSAREALDLYTKVVSNSEEYVRAEGSSFVFTDSINDLKNKMFNLLVHGTTELDVLVTSWRDISRIGVRGSDNKIMYMSAYSSTASAKSRLEDVQNKRMDYAVWLAFVEELRSNEAMRNTGVSFGNGIVDIDYFGYKLAPEYDAPSTLEQLVESYFYQFLRKIAELKISKVSYVTGIRQCNGMINELKQQIAHGTEKVPGITKVFEKRPEAVLKTDWRHKQEEAVALFAKMKNGLTARTWGFEIEVPDAKGVNAPYGIEKGDDGSLRSDNHEDCDCDCNDCAYHSCDCDICEYGSEDPEHCGDSDYCVRADSAEYRTTGGVQRVIHSGMLELCEELNDEDAERNSSAGTHIHVYAHDLTTNEVGQVMAAYYWLTPSVMSPIAGRYNVNYAADLQVSDIANALRKRRPTLRADKPRAVNVSHITSVNGRGTIEFRQQNCNLNGELIHVWAWLVRGLVEVVKRGAKFTDFKEATTLDDVVKIYAKYNFTLESENPGLVIVGSKSDAQKVIKQQHLVR